MLPNHPSPSTTYDYLSPVLSAYNKQAYQRMETAIFPRYFHGKCQQNGVDPPGCPNPDCPVVCGTPGSMVHFYAELREIAFNETRDALATLAAPGSDAYQQVEQAVVQEAQTHSRRMSRIYPRGGPKAAVSSSAKSPSAGSKTVAGYKKPVSAAASSPPPVSGPSSASSSGSATGHEMLVPVFVKKRSDDVQDGLKHIMEQIGAQLAQVCEGQGYDDDSDALPNCSWETAMKEYILTFP